jgi:thiamine pyrophosphokinase
MPAEEGVSERIVVVVSGGGAPAANAARSVPLGAPVIAADRGLEHALALGLDVTVAVGDFDSAAPEAVAAAEESGIRIERHPAEKDATDLELALDVAAEMEPERILVLGSASGRLDHLLSLVLLLASNRYSGPQIDAELGDARVHVIRGARDLVGEPGEVVTLLPAHGPAYSVRTQGLAFPLHGDTLEPGSTRGVSNVFTEARARIEVRYGVVLAIRSGVRT